MRSNTETNTDGLFLLEVLVKELHYSYSSINLDRGLLCSLLETCVHVKFLNYPPLEIRQDITVPDLDYNSPVVIMGTGKSCLFSLNKKAIMCTPKLNITFNVVRICPPGSNCKCVSMGKAVADLSKNFLGLMKKSCCSISPTSRCVRETFSLLNDQCQNIGSISVFLRLSCFGTQITTQFMMSSSGQESYIFKGDDPQNNLQLPSECFNSDCNDDADHDKNTGLYSCLDDGKKNFIGYAGDNWQQNGNFQTPHMQLPQGGQVPYMQIPVMQMQVPQIDVPIPYQNWNSQNMCQRPSSAVNKNYLSHGRGYDDKYQDGKPWCEKEVPCKDQNVAKPCCNNTNFPIPYSTEFRDSKKFYPKMGFYDTTNKQKVGDLKNNFEEESPPISNDFPFCQRVTIGDEESSCDDTPVQECPKLNLCDCDFPTPPGLVNPCPPPKKQKKKKKCCPLELQPGDYCLRSDCPCGLPMVPWMAATMKPNEDDGDDVIEKNVGGKGVRKPMQTKEQRHFKMAPGSVGMKGQQILFQMNDKNIPLTEADKKFMASTQYKIGTIGDASGPKTTVQVLPGQTDKLDPSADKNHDIFILKIGKKNDLNKKAKMQVELKTPKFEDKTPLKRDADTQWLESDLPTPPPDKNDKGKAKKDKKGKGGKKGKKGKGGKKDKKGKKGKKK